MDNFCDAGASLVPWIDEDRTQAAGGTRGGRPFTVAEAAQAGVSPKRLRHRSLQSLGKGMRVQSPTSELPLSARVRPFIEVNTRCAASHLTAKLLRVGSDSPQESLLRLAIVRAGLPEPELNVPITDEAEIRHHQPDLSYRRYKIGIEYEGEQHGDEGQIVRDIARSERYAALGWTEVRISKRHMHDYAIAAGAKVRAALLQAGWRPGR